MRCDRREVGLAWGDYCTVCREERNRVANRIARRVALAGAAIMGLVLFLQRLPDFKSRIFGAAAVVLVYVILRRIVARIVLERRDDRKTAGS